MTIPFTTAQIVSRITVGLVGAILFAVGDYVRRNDRVQGAKDRLEALNRGMGTHSWANPMTPEPRDYDTRIARRRSW